jgi:sugar/nucleoside kinase (ribokinase family)
VNPDVVVVGDLMLDVAVDAPALATGGDVHGTVIARPGGSGANAAVWAARAGARVRFHGRVGDDVTGRVLRDAMTEHGVEAALVVALGRRTGCLLATRVAGERSMVADRGANATVSPEDLPAALEAGAVLVSGYLLFHPTSEPAGLAALDRARAGVVAVEASSWPLVEAYGASRFLEATSKATLLLANEDEARSLTRLDPEAAAKELSDRYAAVCVKLGPSGVLHAEGGRLTHASAPPIEVRDTTGAGDAFDGALLAALARGASTEEALDAGCRAGAEAASSDDAWPPAEARP